MSRPWLSPRCQHNTFTNDRAAKSGELITRSGFLVLDNPGARNKLQPLKADRYIHNESGELSETHGASRNPGRTKTNIWSCKLSLHQPPRPPPVAPTMDPLFSLKHVPMTEQTIPNILSVWLLGGGLVIISVSCYYMSGLGQGGVGSCQQMKKGERGLEDFCWKHNWHSPRDIVRQIVERSRRAPAAFH